MQCRLLSLLFAVSIPLAGQNVTDTTSWRVVPWPEAEQMFHQDRRWLGSDGAYSFPLDSTRILWLFGDTFIARSDSFRRSESIMIRNSIGIQHGTNPSTARITFYWKTEGGRPSSFIPEEGDHWFWFGDGIRIGHVLLIMLARMRSVPEGLGFAYVGPEILFIKNPDDSPGDWTVSRTSLYRDSLFNKHFPSALHSDGSFVYAYLSGDASGVPVRLLRWPVKRLQRLDPQVYEWWDDSTRTWYEPEKLTRAPKPIFIGGQSEFTVQRHCGFSEIMLVQSVGFGATDIAVRWAAKPEGPWTTTHTIHHPSEASLPGAFLYAAKSHAHLTGAPIVLTYAANNFEFNRIVVDSSWYYPRVLRVTTDP